MKKGQNASNGQFFVKLIISCISIVTIATFDEDAPLTNSKESNRYNITFIEKSPHQKSDHQFR